MENQSIQLGIKEWSAWSPGIVSFSEWQNWASGEKELSEEIIKLKCDKLPSMLKRRCSATIRAGIEIAVAITTEEERHNLPFVFSSRHGEAQTIYGLFESLAKNEPLSPNDFSLSVHNSLAGIFSIAFQNQTPSSAIAGSNNSFIAGILEAYLYLKSGSQSVVLIHCDGPLPEVFREKNSTEYPMLAFGFKFNTGNDLRISRIENGIQSLNPEIELLKGLFSEDSLQHLSPPHLSSLPVFSLPVFSLRYGLSLNKINERFKPIL